MPQLLLMTSEYCTIQLLQMKCISCKCTVVHLKHINSQKPTHSRAAVTTAVSLRTRRLKRSALLWTKTTTPALFRLAARSSLFRFDARVRMKWRSDADVPLCTRGMLSGVTPTSLTQTCASAALHTGYLISLRCFRSVMYRTFAFASSFSASTSS